MNYENVIGMYAKRDCPGGEFYCQGSATFLRVENGVNVYLFTPDDKGLRPVEATLE